MKLATDTTDYADGNMGLVEYALSLLNDRSKRYFAKAEIITYVNLEQLHVANRINGWNQEYFLTSATTPLSDTTAWYSVPPDAIHHFDIEVLEDLTDTEGKRLIEVPMSMREFYEQLDSVNEKKDFGFYFIAGSNFKLMPPASATGGQLRVYYVKRLTDLVNNDDESEIPLEHHELLALGAAKRGMGKANRANRNIPQLYRDAMEALERSIPRIAPVRDARTRPWSGTYGPDWMDWPYGREIS